MKYLPDLEVLAYLSGKFGMEWRKKGREAGFQCGVFHDHAFPLCNVLSFFHLF
jgi:hypothetical protein